jgi:protein SCO1/2
VIAVVFAVALGAVDIDEHLGQKLPALSFTDENHQKSELRFQRPTVVALAYFRCQMLCDLVLRGLVDTIAKSKLQLGRDFDAITVSIDPKDTPGAARVRKIALLQALGQTDAPWKFLVGDEASIAQLADRFGFRFVYDPRSDQYAHPAAIFVVTPDGRISRYLYGVRFRPLDLQLAIAEARQEKVGGIVDRVLLTCFKWDPAMRRYGFVVSGVMKGGSALVLLALLLGILHLARRERRR